MAIKYKKLVLAVFTAILSLGVYSIVGSPAFAENATDKKPVHIQISPTKQKLKLEPGQSYVSSFKVTNMGSKQFTYSVSVSPYSVIDENYNADYDNMTNNYTKMANWITIDEKLKTGTLESGKSVEVPFTVTVPKDVPSGGQYAAITAETADGSNSDSAIKTVNRLAMILYADIAGNTRTGGSIISNNVDSFAFEPPIKVSSMIENTGNVESTATCTVKIWPLGSSETVFNNEESQSRFIDVIPDTRRFNTVSWDGSPHLGIFTVEQTIEFLGQTSTVKKLVVICPLWLIALFFAIIVILIIWLIYRSNKRSKAKKNNNQEERRI